MIMRSTGDDCVTTETWSSRYLAMMLRIFRSLGRWDTDYAICRDYRLYNGRQR